jgi:hypothetical protein
MRRTGLALAALTVGLNACIPGELTLSGDAGRPDAPSASDAGDAGHPGDAARDATSADGGTGVCIFDNPGSTFDRGCAFAP